MATEIREIYIKYREGDDLTDDELVRLADHMEEVSGLLCPLGDVFWLPMIEALEVANRLRGYLEARHEKNRQKLTPSTQNSGDIN